MCLVNGSIWGKKIEIFVFGFFPPVPDQWYSLWEIGPQISLPPGCINVFLTYYCQAASFVCFNFLFFIPDLCAPADLVGPASL